VALPPPVEGTIKFLESKFAAGPAILAANLAAFRAGWNYGETTEDFSVSYEVKPARLPAGRYRNISGNLALSYGLIAASRQSGLPLFLGLTRSRRRPTSSTS
jgi:2-oxoglutarate ferredoxin oxidoreductase subunit alpha